MERGNTLLIVHVFVCLFVFIYRPKENSKPRPELCDTEMFYYLSASGSGLRSAIMGCTQANSVAMTPSIEWAPPDCV